MLEFVTAFGMFERRVLTAGLAGWLAIIPLTGVHAQEDGIDGAPPAQEPSAELEQRDPTFFPLPLVQAFSLGGSITSMISGGFSIAHGIQQGKLLAEILNTLNAINAQVEQINQKIDTLTAMMITMQDTINLKFDEVLNQTRQAQLTIPQNKIETAYRQIFGGYAALSMESNLDTDRIQQKVAEVCGKWELEGNNGFYESMQLYDTIMTGSDMNTPAIEALTSLLITRMTLADASSRITASQAMKALSSYVTNHISIQGKGVLCVREIVYANTTRTLAENDKMFNDYLSITIQGDFWARQLALYHKCVGRILAVSTDLSSQANRGSVPLFKEVRNAAGELIFSQDIAENIYCTAELLSCVLLPSLNPPGLYAQLIGDPTLLPPGGLAASLDGGAAMTPMELAPVAIPTAPYLAWWGSPSWSSGINMAMQFSMNESRYYYQAAATGNWTVSAGDASAPLATRPVSAQVYDKTTGALATADTVDENKLLFGAALLPINRLQPDIVWSLPVVHRIAIKDPSVTFGCDGNLVSNVYNSSNSLAYCLRAWDVTSGRRGRRLFDRSATSTQEIRNMGPACKLSFGAKVSMKVRPPKCWFKSDNVGLALGWWKPPFNQEIYASGDPKQNKFNRWSVTKEFVRRLSNYWGMMGWDPPPPNSEAGLPLKKDDTVKIYMDFVIDGYWSSTKFKDDSLFCAYGPRNDWKPYSDFETWSFPGPQFAFTSVPSNTLQGASASCAFGKLPSSAKRSGARGAGADGMTTDSCFFVAFDPLKAKASMATIDYAIPDTWKLLDAGRFSMSENASSVLFFDEQSRSFSHCQFPAQPQSATAPKNAKKADAESVTFTSIAGLTLPEGISYIATGDFNGDGMDDLLVGNPDTGEYKVYIISQSALAETGSLVYDVSLGKPTFHVADFNGDGTDDILACFESTGSYHISLMNGVTVTDSGWLLEDTTGLSLLTVADFDGDDKTELLWVDAESGELIMMYCDGLNIEGLETAMIDGNPSKKGFSIAQLGDFNGDGKTDILWSKIDGKGVQLFLSYMDGGHSLGTKQGRSGPVKLILPTGSAFY